MTQVTCLKWPLIMVTALALTACVKVGPNYVKPEPTVPPNWSRLDGMAGSETKAAATGDISRWWLTLNDPLLSALVDEALQASPDLHSALAKLREARARSAVATSGLYPSVTGSGSASRNRSDNRTQNLFRAGFDAEWELDLFGGVRRGMEAATADVESSEASLENTRVSLVAEVALNYVEVRTLQIRLRIARDNLASQTETLQLTDWRAQAGLVSSQDVDQARSNREQTRARIPALETSLAEAEHRLDVLLGKTPGTLHGQLAAGGDLPSVPAQIAVGIPADALRQRPDVQSAERRLAAETARIGVAEAARYPSFRLSGSIGLEALTVGAMGDSGALTSSLLAGITAPIFNAGKLRNQVVIQDAIREQAQVAYEQSVLTALQDVENALVAFSRNRESSEALMNAAESARNAAQAARQRYGAGLIDFQSVLDTERNVLSVEDSLASTRADRVLALIRLYKALGGGWSPQSQPGAHEKDKS
ncbi:efflux transporter outer membrane subunit [Geotalea sp. SG265]|uniref:efflux transporter outer membrane subunit n=1 Tax=Geotalea sp. SG265 TaxID=2922867 RepID=UPI001FAFF4D5